MATTAPVGYQTMGIHTARTHCSCGSDDLDQPAFEPTDADMLPAA
jgi:hypothetical protein